MIDIILFVSNHVVNTLWSNHSFPFFDVIKNIFSKKKRDWQKRLCKCFAKIPDSLHAKDSPQSSCSVSLKRADT